LSLNVSFSLSEEGGREDGRGRGHVRVRVAARRIR
jgi:hypothetical protein